MKLSHAWLLSCALQSCESDGLAKTCVTTVKMPTCVFGVLVLLCHTDSNVGQPQGVELIGKARHKFGVEGDEDIRSLKVGQLQALLYSDRQLVPELPLVMVCRQHTASCP